MDMEQWARVRRKVLIEKRSKRSVMAEEKLHWDTLQKMLAHSRPPGYRRVKKVERKIDAHVEWVRGVLKRDREVPRKQRHTAKRIFDRLRAERGYAGGHTAVKEVVMHSQRPPPPANSWSIVLPPSRFRPGGRRQENPPLRRLRNGGGWKVRPPGSRTRPVSPGKSLARMEAEIAGPSHWAVLRHRPPV